MNLITLQIANGSQQLNQSVEKITNSSIQMAEAASNYGALKVIFGIFMIFMILIVVVFVYQIFVLTHKINYIHHAALKTTTYFEGVADRTIGDAQAQVMVRRAVNSLSQNIKYNILRIKLENNISNRVNTQNKVSRVIRNEYSELNSFLANFLCHDRPLSSVLNEEDIEVIEAFMIEQIYVPKEEFLVSNMDQSVMILLNGIKLNYLKNL